MARRRRAGIILAIALAGLLAGLLVARDPTAGPERVSLAAIHRQTERYEGRRVEVTGVVRAFDDAGGRYDVLEDTAGQNRVLLRAAPAALAGRVGCRCTAVGVVGFDERRGIYLAVEALAPGAR
ncbi:MAG TPA: hypothetical protein VFL91_04750 [Thermomicrobiales bacterium]|nr:hypothetical protein [Thermomicrobiales bacterium]